MLLFSLKHPRVADHTNWLCHRCVCIYTNPKFAARHQWRLKPSSCEHLLPPCNLDCSTLLYPVSLIFRCWDDQHRNTNINTKDHLVGQLTTSTVAAITPLHVRLTCWSATQICWWLRFFWKYSGSQFFLKIFWFTKISENILVKIQIEIHWVPYSITKYTENVASKIVTYLFWTEYNEWGIEIQLLMRRNTVLIIIWVGAITLSRGGGGEQVKDACWRTPRPGEHAKCFKAEENARGREQPDERWKTEREWWTWDSLRSDVEKQGWLWMGGKIGQCKQSLWQPLCRWERNMLGHSSQFRSTGNLSRMQGHPRRWLKPGVLLQWAGEMVQVLKLDQTTQLLWEWKEVPSKIEAWWAGLPCSNGHCCCCCKPLEKCTSANRWPTFEPPSKFWATKPLPLCNWLFQPSYWLPFNYALKTAFSSSSNK